MELFKLLGIISLEGMDKFKGDVDSATNQGSKLGEKFGSALKTVGNATVAAVGAAATATGAIVKKSLDEYSNYEQLVGGVNTLFKSSGEKVIKYANEAYKNQGLSANAYMETVTSFSASLLQSLEGDTNAAADKANIALTDMSDNANKMGTDMSSIQNAYQGFAKQNYTMLDNLKLGYGGTKEEMERLIADANKLRKEQGLNADLTIDSYADVVDAIHTVQEEMGIANATREEAETTIQGSLNATKAAWENLMTGLGDGSADLTVLLSNFTGSIAIAAENILPRIQQILLGVGTMVAQLAPVISSAIPGLISQVIPGLLQAGIQLITALLEGIKSNADSIAQGAVEIVSLLATGISNLLPLIIQTGVQLLVSFVNALISDPDQLVTSAFEIITTIASALIDALPQIIESGIQLIFALIQGILDNLPQIIETGAELVYNLLAGVARELVSVVTKGAELVWNFIKGIFCGESEVENAGDEMGSSFVSGASGQAEAAAEVGVDLGTSFTSGVGDSASLANAAAVGSKTASSVIEGVGSQADAAYAAGASTGEKASAGVESKEAEARQTGSNTAHEIVVGIESQASAAINAGTMIGRKVIEGLKSQDSQAESAGVSLVEKVASGITSALQSIYSAGQSIVDKLQSGIQSKWSGVSSWFKNLCEKTFKASVSVRVTTSAGSSNGEGYATGLDYVPYDEFPATLHKGEMVVPASQADYLRAGAFTQATAEGNAAILSILSQILGSISALNNDMGNNMREALDGTSLKVNNREFGRIVRTVTA